MIQMWEMKLKNTEWKQILPAKYTYDYFINNDSIIILHVANNFSHKTNITFTYRQIFLVLFYLTNR